MGWTGKQKAKTRKRYDTSQLTSSLRGHLVHRDYAAHFFRWGWAKRFIKAGMRVLDVGCGRDTPLAKVLKGNLSHVPSIYLGVDYQEVDAPAGNSWVRTLGGFDFATRYEEIEGPKFDVVVCFEAIEHMRKKDGLRLLAGLKHHLAPDGKILLSTPVYDGRRMAAAHLHEWKFEELRDALTASGLKMYTVFGTFASYPDIKKAATSHDLNVLERLRDYYDDDVAACFLAPMYPTASRN